MYFSQMYRKSPAHVITYICIQVYMKTYTHLPAIIQIYFNYYQNSVTSLELFFNSFLYFYLVDLTVGQVIASLLGTLVLS